MKGRRAGRGKKVGGGVVGPIDVIDVEVRIKRMYLGATGPKAYWENYDD